MLVACYVLVFSILGGAFQAELAALRLGFRWLIMWFVADCALLSYIYIYRERERDRERERKGD